AGIITATGNVSFGGGSETGLLSAGVIQLGGNFAQTGGTTSFIGSGTHQVQFIGATQSLSFATVTGTSTFGSVLFNSGTVTASTDFFATNVQLGVGVISVTGTGVAAHIGTGFSDPNARWAMPAT